MNKTALGLAALGFVLFSAPAFAEEQKTETKEESSTGKKGSSYKAEKTTKSDDGMKSTTTTQDKVEKSSKSNAQGGMDKHPDGKSTTTKDKSSTDATGDVTKPEKKPNN